MKKETHETEDTPWVQASSLKRKKRFTPDKVSEVHISKVQGRTGFVKESIEFFADKIQKQANPKHEIENTFQSKTKRSEKVQQNVPKRSEAKRAWQEWQNTHPFDAGYPEYVESLPKRSETPQRAPPNCLGPLRGKAVKPLKPGRKPQSCAKTSELCELPPCLCLSDLELKKLHRLSHDSARKLARFLWNAVPVDKRASRNVRAAWHDIASRLTVLVNGCTCVKAKRPSGKFGGNFKAASLRLV